MERMELFLAAIILATPLLAGSGEGAEQQWAEGVPYTTNWDEAIKQCRETGKLLFIFNGWEKNVCAPCNSLKATIRKFAAAEDAENFRSSFVFLNVYCKNMKEEKQPRGPEGPYRFTDETVPITVIKRWDGKTLLQKRGFFLDDKKRIRTDMLKNWTKTALKQNGKIISYDRATMTRLLASFDKAEQAVSGGKPAEAYALFEELVRMGKDKETFPDGAAHPCVIAEECTEEILSEAEKAIASLIQIESDVDREQRRKELHALYGNIEKLADKLVPSPQASAEKSSG